MESSFCNKRVLFSSLELQSKDALENVMALQSASNNLSSIKSDLIRVRGLQELSNNEGTSSHHLQINENIPNLTIQNKSTNLHNSAILSSEKSLNLTSFNNTTQLSQTGNDLNLENNSLPDNHHHYYEGLNPTPIMLYQVAAGSIVPFESLVTVPLSKPEGDKHEVSANLLQNSLPQEAYNNTDESVSHPLYILPDKDKGSGNEKMLISHIYSAEDSGNLFLDTRQSYSNSEKCEISRPISELINSEFNISSSNYDAMSSNSVMNNLSLSSSYITSTDSDSEVALTLASLGTLKNQKVNNRCNEDQKEWGSFSNQKVDEDMFVDQIGGSKETGKMSMQSTHKGFGPTLVLRSRKSRGGSAPIIDIKKHLSEDKIENKLISNKRKSNKIKCLQKEKSVASITSLDIFKDPPFKKPSKPPIKKKVSSEHQKENLLGQLLKASKHCEPASLIPEGVVDDVIPAVGYRIMDMSNLSEMIRMMHRCSNVAAGGPIVIQEQASLREGAVSQLSIICTGCQEGAVCATSNKAAELFWDINARVELLTKEFNVEEAQVQKMLEILGIFYRPTTDTPVVCKEEPEEEIIKKRKKKIFKKEKNLECKICHTKFYGANHLKSHMNTHDIQLHSCPYCHAYFKKSYNLKEHVRKHENVKYECSYCSRLYIDRSSLTKHIKFIHEGKWAAECDICSKKFCNLSNYKEHLRIHTGEKPFACEVCGKKYAWHDSVKKHMQTHSAESKFKCNLCGKWFRWLLGVRQHLLQQHKLKKSDIEAQVVTAVAEALPTSSLTKKERDANSSKFS